MRYDRRFVEAASRLLRAATEHQERVSPRRSFVSLSPVSRHEELARVHHTGNPTHLVVCISHIRCPFWPPRPTLALAFLLSSLVRETCPHLASWYRDIIATRNRSTKRLKSELRVHTFVFTAAEKYLLPIGTIFFSFLTV